MVKLPRKLWRVYVKAVGIIFLMYFLYLAIKLSIVNQPIDIDSAKVTMVQIVYTDADERKRYTVKIEDQKVIQDLVKKTNNFKVTERGKSGSSNYLMTIYFKYDIEYYYTVHFWGNSITLGDESFKIRKKDKKDYIEYIKYLIEESDNCIVEDR